MTSVSFSKSKSSPAGAFVADEVKSVRLSYVIDIVKSAGKHFGLTPATVSSEWLATVVSFVKVKSVSTSPPALTELFNALFLKNHSDEELRDLFTACPFKACFSLMVNQADGVSSDDPQYGEKKILSTPNVLKDILYSLPEVGLSEQGKCLFEAFQAWERETLNTIKTTLQRGDWSFEAFGEALSIAVSRGDSDLVNFLLRDDEDKYSFHLRSALIHAASTNRLEVLEFFLRDRRYVGQGVLGLLLHTAAEYGHLAIVEFLLSGDNKITPRDFTKAFLKAASNGHLLVLAVVLTHDKTIGNHEFGLAIEKAASSGHLAIIEFLLSKHRINPDAIAESVVQAVKGNHLVVIEFLFSLGIPINSTAFGKAVECAVSDGYLDIVKFLLGTGLDLRKDFFTRSIEKAASMRYLSILEELFCKEKSIGEDVLNYGVIHAVSKGYLDVVKFLLSDGRSISQEDLGKAIESAAVHDNIEIVKYLLNKILLPKDCILSQKHMELIADALFEIRDPTIKESLFKNYVSFLFRYSFRLEKIMEPSFFSEGTNADKHYIQLMIYFLSFVQKVTNLDIFLANIRSYKDTFRSFENFRPLLNFVDLLAKFSCPNKDEIIIALLPLSKEHNKDKNSKLQVKIAYMTALLALESMEWIEEFLIVPPESAKKLLRSRFMEELSHFGSVEFSLEDFTKAYKTMRNPTALFSYFKTVKAYPQLGDLYFDLLNNFINGHFTSWRNGKLSSKHINKMDSEFKSIWERWLIPEVADVSLSVEGASSSSTDILEYILLKFRDNHHIQANGTIHPLLEGFSEILTKSKDELQAVLDELQSGAFLPDHIITKVALLTMILSSDAAMKIEGVDQALHKLKEGGNCPLIHDLESLKRSLRAPQSSSTSCIVTNTDQFEDLFLCGTEVIGSCQSIKAAPYTNCCLLGYVVDAKNRMIAVKSKSGQIQSRAIFRLLFKEGAPVLFLDRPYSKFPSVPMEHDAAIKQHAKDVAISLGLNLYFYDESGWSSLESLGSPAPFEYEDATGGGIGAGITTGDYFVKKASLLLENLL